MPKTKADDAALPEGQLADGSGVITFPAKPRVPLGQAIPETAGGATPSFSDHGGPVIPHVRLILVFWGSWWNSTSAVPSVGQVTDAVVNILTGPYMSSLAQYRGIGSGYLQSSIVVSTAIGNSPASPPASFSNSDVSTLLTNMLTAGLMPGPATDAELLYMVMLPPGATQPGLLGEHTYAGVNNTNLHFGWVANGGSLESVTWVFSHELVESCTDPEGSAITGTGCNQGGWCEIGDVCTGNTAVINGVTVQRYWSQADQACVVPTDAIVKTDKDNKDHKDGKDHKDVKEHKVEHKELKDGALEKLPELPRPAGPGQDELTQAAISLQRIAQLSQALAGEAAALSDQLGGQPGSGPSGSGQSFIQPGERPPVGEQALREPSASRRLY
jgi:hypothetical protein